jgi:hypothetical protein
MNAIAVSVPSSIIPARPRALPHSRHPRARRVARRLAGLLLSAIWSTVLLATGVLIAVVTAVSLTVAAWIYIR